MTALLKSSVNQYLEELPQAVQTRLYESPATCLAIYRLLPPLAKFFVMAMVFSGGDASVRDLDRWVRPSAKRQFQEAVQSLKSLHLLMPSARGSGDPGDGSPGDANSGVANSGVALNPTFRQSVKNALTGGEVHNSFGRVVAGHIATAVLEEYARDKWETILHFMVGTPLPHMPANKVLVLLKRAGLMEEVEATGGFRITTAGFQFLLQEPAAQLWALLLQYVRSTEAAGTSPVDALNVVFMLGSLEFGRCYSTRGLSATQRTLVQDMRDYGLVYQDGGNAEVFYPTRLAMLLTSDARSARTAAGAMDSVLEASRAGVAAGPDAGTGTETETETGTDAGVGAGNGAGVAAGSVAGSVAGAVADGALVVETNFKVYSYSNSPLQIAILSLFVHLRSRFANMVTGQITRESIRNALSNGITADQIIAYLSSHAHPHMRRLAEQQLKKKLELDPAARDVLQVLPPTVVDQVQLWQLELDRILSYDGSLYSDFDTAAEYNTLCAYAQDLGGLVWRDDRKRKFFVTRDANSQVLAYAKRKLAR